MFVLVAVGIAGYQLYLAITRAFNTYSDSKVRVDYSNVIDIELYIELKACGYHTAANQASDLVSKTILLRRRDAMIERVKRIR